MIAEPAIDVTGLGKRYVRAGPARRHDTLRDQLVASITDRRHEPRAFWALSDVSFKISRGENVGIIGLNGAGKSTLLKILSRITEPTTGTARICGRVGTLLEVGTGFHGELSGRENIYLYGSILGMRRAEINARYKPIVDFAEIDDFIDTPVKRYSSGMYVRLAFSVAAHLEPDILLLDEVLAVGDVSFQRKCIEFTKRLQRRSATILFVSHNMFSIKSMCDRVIYLKGGKVEHDGSIEEGIRLYNEDCKGSAIPWMGSSDAASPVVVEDASVVDAHGRSKAIFEHGERLRLRIRYTASKQLSSPNFIIAVIRSDGVACCNYCTETDGVDLGMVEGSGMLELLTPPLKLVAELYTVHVLVRESGFQKLLCAQVAATFHIRDPLFDTAFGVFHECAEWRVECASANVTRVADAVDMDP